MAQMEKGMTRWLALILLPVVVCSFLLPADEDNRLVKIRGVLERFDTEYPQQKVYLQLDKTIYRVGEDIWFKAYVLDGMTHKPLDNVTNLYVELVNAHNIIVQVKLIKIRNGVGWGDFVLRDTTPEGNFLVRSYTPWMTNFDPSFYFHRNIYVVNPSNKNFISSEDIRFNRHYNRKLKKAAAKFNMQFFPEGGNMVDNMESLVAFKVSDYLDRGIQATGTLRDSKGHEIASFSTVHAGMGAFSFTPSYGQAYYADIRYANGGKDKFKLPEPLKIGYVMHVETLENNRLRVSVRTNRPLTQDPLANDIILVIQTRGKIDFAEVIDMPENHMTKTIDAAAFPEGICQVTLFDGRGTPQAERLAYIQEDSFPVIEIRGINSDYHTRDKVETDIEVKLPGSTRVQGSYSVSVAMVKDSLQPESFILSDLLLTSDLHGAIEYPAWYFEKRDAVHKAGLDLLMLTHGWRRFKWGDLLAGKFPEAQYKEEKGITISGRITRDFFDIPIRNAKVSLTILSAYNDYFKTTTDKNGRFMFDNLDYPDTISVVLEASKPNGRKNLVILVDENEFKPAYTRNADAHTQAVLAKGEDWRYRNVKRIDFTKDPEKEKIVEHSKPFKLHNSADNVIFMKDVPDGYTDMFQVLQGRVPGVSVVGNSVSIRGTNSLYLSNDPLFLIDGTQVSASTFRMVNPKDVEYIEILKGPSAAIYGIQGANGVIAAYTKRGEFVKRGYLDFKMLGYATPREFYRTDYSQHLSTGINDLRTTLYWNPDLKIDDHGKATIHFYTSDQKGAFLFQVEGITTNGQPSGGWTLFRVDR